REPWNKLGVEALHTASAQDIEQDEPKCKPTIDITYRWLPDLSSEAISALEVKNEPPEIFVRGGRLCRFLVDETDRPFIQSMDEHEVRHFIARSANWVKYDGRRKKTIPTAPPTAVVRDVIAQGHWRFPALEGIVAAPVLRPDGTVLD